MPALPTLPTPGPTRRYPSWPCPAIPRQKALCRRRPLITERLPFLTYASSSLPNKHADVLELFIAFLPSIKIALGLLQDCELKLPATEHFLNAAIADTSL